MVQNIQSQEKKSKRLASIRSRGNSFVKDQNDDFQIFIPNDFSEFIVPKINKI